MHSEAVTVTQTKLAFYPTTQHVSRIHPSIVSGPARVRSEERHIIEFHSCRRLETRGKVTQITHPLFSESATAPASHVVRNRITSEHFSEFAHTPQQNSNGRRLQNEFWPARASSQNHHLLASCQNFECWCCNTSVLVWKEQNTANNFFVNSIADN